MVGAKEDLAETVCPLRAQGVQLPLQLNLPTSEICSLTANFINSGIYPMMFHCLLEQTVQHTSHFWSGGKVSVSGSIL